MFTDRFGNTYYKLGLHIHTTCSDGSKTPAEVAREYRENGYDAIAFTDHWFYGEGGELEGLTILSGCEYNLNGNQYDEGVMHIVGLGMQYAPDLTPECSRQQIVDGIRAAGGLAVLAHPYWSLNGVEDLENLNGVFATEIYNAVSEAHNSMRAYSDHFVDLAANRGLYPYLLATDDAHYYDGSDNCRGFVMVRAASSSAADLLQALQRGDFYASQGPHIALERKGNTLVIDCSPACVIATISNAAWLPERVLRGENLTHFEYRIKSKERWIRAEVIDADGRKAWSNIIPLV